MAGIEGESAAAITWYRSECGDVCVIIIPKDRFKEAQDLLPEYGFNTFIGRLEKAGIPFEFIPQTWSYEHIVDSPE